MFPTDLLNKLTKQKKSAEKQAQNSGTKIRFTSNLYTDGFSHIDLYDKGSNTLNRSYK